MSVVDRVPTESEEHPERILRDLRSFRSPADVLAVAMAFEKKTHDLLVRLGQELPAEMQPLVQQLATELIAQYRQLQTLAEDSRLGDRLARRLRSPPLLPSGETAVIHLPLLPDDALDQEILDYALSIERVAFEYYVYLLGLQ
jgi:hypothetical protein